MKKLVFYIILMMSSVIGFGQSTIKLSPKHQDKLDKITDPYKRILKYKKYHLKDSLKQAKRQLKEQTIVKSKKVLKDSLNSIPEIAEYQPTIQEVAQIDSTAITEKINQLKKEAINNKIESDIISVPKDSAALIGQAKEKTLQQLQKTSGVDVSGVTLDSTSVESAKKKAKDTAIKKGEEYLKNTDEYESLNGLEKEGSYGELDAYKEQLAKTQKEIKELAIKNELKKKMTSKAKEFITKNASQIQQVQSKMTDLKKKYSSVPNSNDLTTARKRTSLKGASIWKRLVVGGNFNITKINPVTLDLSPVLGYRINKLFETGVSATYRVQFKASSSSVTKDDAVYGQSIWANHLFYKNYFGYLEGERMSTVVTQDDISTRSWKESLLIGVGRKFKVAKWLEMQALILFNVLYNNEDQLYSSPVVFKTGFRVNP